MAIHRENCITLEFFMKDLDDLTLKTEIEEISKKIDAILQQVDQANPLRANEETSQEK